MAPKTKKKPAGVGMTKKKPASSASLGARGLAASLTEDPAAEQSGHRDRLKQHQWKRSFDDFPQSVKEEWEKAGRARKTQMVNSLIVRNQDGSYKFNNDSALLKEINTKYQDRYQDARVEGEIQEVMEQMCGGAEQLSYN